MTERPKNSFSRENLDIPKQLQLASFQAKEIISVNELNERLGVSEEADRQILRMFISESLLRDKFNKLSQRTLRLRIYSLFRNLEKRKKDYTDALDHLQVLRGIYIRRHFTTEEAQLRAREIGNAVNDLFIRGKKRFETGLNPNEFHIDDLRAWENDWKPRLQR